MAENTSYEHRIVRYEEIHDVAVADFAAFVSAAQLRPASRVLDCGCGYGACTRELLLHHRADEVVCVDLVDESAVQLSRAREELKPFEHVQGVTLAYECAEFPDRFAPTDRYDVAFAKMVLHEVAREKQPAFVGSLIRALVPGGRLLFWDVCTQTNQIRDFTQAVIRSKDALAGFVSLADRRNLSTEQDISDLLEQSGVVMTRRLKTIGYTLDTRRRLVPEFGGDESLLQAWHDAIRRAASSLPASVLDELHYVDAGNTITFTIRKGLYRAERAARTAFNLRPFANVPIGLDEQEPAPVFREVLETSLAAASLPASLKGQQGLLRPTVLYRSDDGTQEICRGGFEYLYNYDEQPTSPAWRIHAEAFVAYMTWVHSSQLHLRSLGLSSSMSDALNQVLIGCPSIAWACTHLVEERLVGIQLSTYSGVAGEALIRVQPGASEFFDAVTERSAGFQLRPVQVPDVSRLLLADGSSIDAAASQAADELGNLWATRYANLHSAPLDATVLCPSAALHQFLLRHHVLVPLAEYLRRSGTPFCYYVFPPSLLVANRNRETRRLEQGVFILSTTTELSPDHLQYLLCYVAGLWSGLGAVDAKLSERFAQGQKRSRDLAAGSYKIGHPMKDRLATVRMYLNTAREYVRLARPSEAVSPVLRNASNHLSRAERLGHILDIISRAISSGAGAELFLEKRMWHTDKPYDIPHRLAQFEAMVNSYASIESEYSPILLQPRPDDWRDRTFVEQWLPSLSQRPGDLFYDELLSEVLVNASHNGKPSADGSVEVRCDIASIYLPDEESTCMGLVFSNASKKRVAAQKLGLTHGKWMRFDTTESGAVGGLFFLAMYLESTGAGLLAARVDVLPNHDDFSIGLCLKGLSCETRGKERTDDAEDQGAVA